MPTCSLLAQKQKCQQQAYSRKIEFGAIPTSVVTSALLCRRSGRLLSTTDNPGAGTAAAASPTLETAASIMAAVLPTSARSRLGAAALLSTTEVAAATGSAAGAAASMTDADACVQVHTAFSNRVHGSSLWMFLCATQNTQYSNKCETGHTGIMQ